MLDLPLKLWRDEAGQDIAEYAVMLAVILVLVVGTIRLVGSNPIMRSPPSQARSNKNLVQTLNGSHSHAGETLFTFQFRASHNWFEVTSCRPGEKLRSVSGAGDACLLARRTSKSHRPSQP